VTQGEAYCAALFDRGVGDTRSGVSARPLREAPGWDRPAGGASASLVNQQSAGRWASLGLRFSSVSGGAAQQQPEQLLGSFLLLAWQGLGWGLAAKRAASAGRVPGRSLAAAIWTPDVVWPDRLWPDVVWPDGL